MSQKRQLAGIKNSTSCVAVELEVEVAVRSKAWVCGRSPAEIPGSNPSGGMDVCLL